MRDSYHDLARLNSLIVPAASLRRELTQLAAESSFAAAEALCMTEAQVTRWRKYGKDRLGVNGADGFASDSWTTSHVNGSWNALK
jgi:hypothetical protein